MMMGRASGRVMLVDTGWVQAGDNFALPHQTACLAMRSSQRLREFTLGIPTHVAEDCSMFRLRNISTTGADFREALTMGA
jgi:hypothetical protein